MLRFIIHHVLNVVHPRLVKLITGLLVVLDRFLSLLRLRLLLLQSLHVVAHVTLHSCQERCLVLNYLVCGDLLHFL